MNKSVFDFRDYRSYLTAKLGPTGRRTGLRSKACQVLGCHSTYLSQVLMGKTELSLEYGEAFNRFFSHTKEEGDYFILLLLKERAGSVNLKERFQKQIDAIQTERATLKKRHKESSEISSMDQDRFYSSWIYGALHVLASLPKIKSRADLAEKLGISIARANDAFSFLEKIGLVVNVEEGFQIGPRHIHLGADSVLIQKHHMNWRYHVIQSLTDRNPDDLHYSGAISLSQSAVAMIRENLLRSFQENMELVREARDEVAYVYNFDFYRLDR